MSFTSPFFVLLVAAALLAWWILPFRTAKAALCILNLVFYGYWYPPFLALLIISGLIDYTAGQKICGSRSERSRRFWLGMSLTANLGLLGYFKYAQFFVDSLIASLNTAGLHLDPLFLDILLPMGISFYTFQSMSYTIDIFRRQMHPADSFVDFFMYLGFFPQLVAGPIVRAAHFVPQLKQRMRVTRDDVFVGLFRIARGFFLKVVIADNIAVAVGTVFGSSPPSGLWVAWFGVLVFAIQIFCDFAGYSEIAIGLGRLFGLRIPENFINPYAAKSIQDFWRRWHISLSTWFRDYVYIPLGGGHGLRSTIWKNTLIVFLVSGLWHGANWTFVIWGGLHGFALVFERLIRSRVWPDTRLVREVAPRVLVLLFVLVAWVAFRSPNIAYTTSYWRQMFLGSPDPAQLLKLNPAHFLWPLIFVTWQVGAAVTERMEIRMSAWRQIEAAVYVSAVLLMPGPPIDFIYFQF